MVILQEEQKRFSLTIPKALVTSRGWKKGDDIAFMAVGPEVLPSPGDLVLKRVRMAEREPVRKGRR